MRSASELADWWDEQHKDYKKVLDQFVDDNPNLFGVLVATAAATASDLGAGMVDVLRFGEGLAAAKEADTAWGVAKGVGTDALRLIGIAGPLGRGARALAIPGQATKGARLARLVVDPGGPRCGYVSATMALKQTGQKAFTSVDDLAQALGQRLDDLGGSSLAQRVQQLRGIGAKVGAAKDVSNWDEVLRATRRDGSVTMVSIKGMQGTDEVGHAIYTFFDHQAGRIRIMDRGGSPGTLPQVVETLEELAGKYGVESWTPRGIAILENVFMRWIGPKGTATLAMEVLASTKEDPETVAQAFEVRKMVATGQRPTPSKGESKEKAKGNGVFHTVVRGDWLSKIAKKYYGNMHKWPVIFEANRKSKDNPKGVENPDLIFPDQVLWIPDLPKVDAGKKK